jgi:Xaa-Pro aminopeptidase
VSKYANIGIRVEDSFVMEREGVRSLTGRAPRTVDEIETFMRNRRLTSGGR